VLCFDLVMLVFVVVRVFDVGWFVLDVCIGIFGWMYVFWCRVFYFAGLF